MASYTGYFYAATTGTYTFATNSDDNSRVVGQAARIPPSCKTPLTARAGPVMAYPGKRHGEPDRRQYYPITVGYDEGNGGFGLEAFYATPGNTIANNNFIPLSLLSTPSLASFGNNVVVDGGSQTMNLTGGTVAFGSLQIGATGATTFHVVAAGALPGMATFTSTTIGNNPVFDVQSSNVLDLGEVGGTGGLTLTGSGTLVLSGNATYPGSTTVTGGTLQIGNGGTSGSWGGGALVMNGNTLAFNRSDNIEITQVLNSGVVANSGPGTVTLSAANTYAGGTVVNNGAITANNNAALGSGPVYVGSAGTLNMVMPTPNAISSLSGGGTVVLGNANNSTPTHLTLNTASGNINFAGSINEAYGPSTVIKSGAGLLTLSGNSNYTGGTTITAGTLNASGNSVGSGNINVTNATFQPNFGQQGLTAQYYGPFLGNYTAITTTSLAAFNTTVLGGIKPGLTNNITANVVNGANGNFDFDTGTQGSLFPRHGTRAMPARLMVIQGLPAAIPTGSASTRATSTPPPPAPIRLPPTATTTAASGSAAATRPWSPTAPAPADRAGQATASPRTRSGA